MSKRREISIFNLSFLDVLSCGMGCIILLTLVFSTLVREKAARRGTRLLIVVEFKKPHLSHEVVLRKDGEEKKLQRMKNRPIHVLSVRNPAAGRWILETSSKPQGYSLLILYGGYKIRAMESQKKIPGVLDIQRGSLPTFQTR